MISRSLGLSVGVFCRTSAENVDLEASGVSDDLKPS